MNKTVKNVLFGIALFEIISMIVTLFSDLLSLIISDDVVNAYDLKYKTVVLIISLVVILFVLIITLISRTKARKAIPLATIILSFIWFLMMFILSSADDYISASLKASYIVYSAQGMICLIILFIDTITNKKEIQVVEENIHEN